MNIVDYVEKQHMDKDMGEFTPGDTVRVDVKIREGGKFRIQAFEGVVIALRGKGLNATFTVRKVSSGCGVERIFPFHSPNIDSMKVVKKGKVRRAKLYYLRSRKGRAARVKEKVSFN